MKMLCKKGHVTPMTSPVPFCVTSTCLDPPIESGPLCVVCFVEWHREMFGAEDIGDAGTPKREEPAE